jgi:hypothetical protein
MPEEAEALIPLMRDLNVNVNTHLLVYSAPITRKMLQFNDMNFHSIPPLPLSWKAPSWLQVELGIYSGRLYFEWEEYHSMCALLGIQEGTTENDVEADGEDPEGQASLEDSEVSRPTACEQKQLVQTPLTFLQEWLAVRRRGQDFAHSPMGFVSQGKRLQEDHIFFKQAEHFSIQCSDTMAPLPFSAPTDRHEHQDDGEYGVDDMGANEACSDSSDDEIEYDESEYGSTSSSD